MATVELIYSMAYVPIIILNAEVAGTYLRSLRKETSRYVSLLNGDVISSPETEPKPVMANWLASLRS